MIDNPAIYYAKLELISIDQKSIRAIREGNTSRIAELELQASVIRQSLAEMPLQIELDTGLPHI